MSRNWLVLVICCAATAAAGADRPIVVSKTLFIPAPTSGGASWAKTFYTQPQGLDLMCIRSTEGDAGSDVYHNWQQRFSSDNGTTWSAWEAMHTDPGIPLYQRQPGWVDPVNGRMLMMESIAISNWFTDGSVRYHVSTDGGHTFDVDQPVIQTGSQYNVTHPIEGVTIGQNAFQVSATIPGPIRTRSGKVLVPLTIIHPGGHDFSDSAVLIGDWNSDKTIAWDLSQRVVGDSTKSTAGYYEPTIAEMPDGRLLMVMRGNNAGNPGLPGYKWYSVSAAGDNGCHWSDPMPWTYTDGSNFFSPASCSQLLQHSNGKYYWIGNISSANTNGNEPRYPLVIGQVNAQSLLLDRDTITAIDTIQPGESSLLQLSNFAAYEDRVTHEIVLNVTRYLPSTNGWVGDSFVYRIDVLPEPSIASMAFTALIGVGACSWQRWNPLVQQLRAHFLR